jgi:hypothetical protein
MVSMSSAHRVVKVDDRPPIVEEDYSPEWLSPDQASDWDAFAFGCAGGSLYHTAAWKRMIESAFPHIGGRFLVLRGVDSRRIQAGLPVYHVKSWLLGSRLASIPFATVCDPLVTTPRQWAALLPELETERARTESKKVAISAVLTPGPVPPIFRSQSLFRHHLLSLDADFDAICRRFDKQSVRQKAEKARKAGVVIEEQHDETGMILSHLLLAETRRRLSLPPMPYRFFEAMHNHLGPGHLKVLLAHLNGRPVACHIVLIYRDQWISEYSANADGAMSGVNQLLYLETIRLACAAGAQRFSFGRTSVHSEGLLSYKRRWGTVEENLTDYTLRLTQDDEAPASEEAFHSEDSPLYKLCKRIIAKAPMPVCKLVGDFCYRHLG